jgi:hypothetical protein
MNTLAKPITTVHIIGKRWFDKTYGNTYYKAYVTLYNGDEEIHRFSIGKNYGYGSSYMYDSFTYMAEEGIIAGYAQNDNGSWPSPLEWCKDNAILLIYNHVDVNRKKDL